MTQSAHTNYTKKDKSSRPSSTHSLSLSLLYPFCLYTLVLPTYNNEPAVWPDWVTFLKFLTTKFLAKDWQLWGLFWKTSFSFKNLIDYFLGNFWKNLATFFSNIWSHCYLYKTLCLLLTTETNILFSHFMYLGLCADLTILQSINLRSNKSTRYRIFLHLHKPDVALTRGYVVTQRQIL